MARFRLELAGAVARSNELLGSFPAHFSGDVRCVRALAFAKAGAGAVSLDEDTRRALLLLETIDGVLTVAPSLLRPVGPEHEVALTAKGRALVDELAGARCGGGALIESRGGRDGGDGENDLRALGPLDEEAMDVGWKLAPLLREIRPPMTDRPLLRCLERVSELVLSLLPLEGSCSSLHLCRRLPRAALPFVPSACRLLHVEGLVVTTPAPQGFSQVGLTSTGQALMAGRRETRGA